MLIKLSQESKQHPDIESLVQIMYPYKQDNYDYKVMIQFTPEQFENFERDDVSLESLHEYLEKEIGNSEVISVAVEMTNSSPYWKLLHFVDSDNNIFKS